MDAEPQGKPSFKNGTYLRLIFPLLATFIGIIITGFGALFQIDSSRMMANAGQTMMYVGIPILVLGIIGSITYYHSMTQTSSTTLRIRHMSDTTNVVTPNTISESLQPPSVVESGSLPRNVYSYDPVERIEFLQLQPAPNHYLPVQRSFNQYPPVQAVAIPAVPPGIKPEEPPPRYEEVMLGWGNSTNASAESEYGLDIQITNNIRDACRERLAQVNDRLQIPGARYRETAV